MNFVISTPRGVARIFGAAAIATLMSGPLSSKASSAESGAPVSKEAAPAATAPPSQADWRAAMSRLPAPKQGCFEGTYPDVEWKEVPCVSTPAYPQLPGLGVQVNTVGGGGANDFSARVSSGLISSAQGSFDSVTGVTYESGQINGNGPQITNAYTLQLNTNPTLPTALCSTSPNPKCKGWEQFVFDSAASQIYIQYWLITYNASCSNLPGTWNQFSFPNSSNIYCWRNDLAQGTSVPPQPINNLGQMRAIASIGGVGDSLQFWAGNKPYLVVGDNPFNLAPSWTDAEFNVFGDGGGAQANFNIGTTIVVRTSVNNGTQIAPLCPAESFTGETNNTYLILPCSAFGGPAPAIVFTERWVAPAAASAPFVDVYSGHDQQHFAYLATNANGRIGEIWDVFFCPSCSGSKWQLQKINSGGVTNGPPAFSPPSVDVYWGHDQQHFSYLGASFLKTGGFFSSGQIWDAFFCPGCGGSQWQLQPINCGTNSTCTNKFSNAATDGPAAVSGPFIDTYAEADQQHFAYLAANGEIWDAFFCAGCAGNQWRLQEINMGGVTTGPPAASAPFVNVYTGHNQQHFAYLGPGGAIWDAYYCPGCSPNHWQLQAINCGPNSSCLGKYPDAVTDGPPAVSGPFVDTYAEANQQHFAYLAANGEIWDAFYCPGCSGKPWRLQEINMGGATSGPPAASAPFVNVFSGHNQQHFVYLGTAVGARGPSGQIWDAFYCPSCTPNPWVLQTINCGPNSSCPVKLPNAVTNGPPAIAGPFVDTYAEANQQHFAYLAASGDIWDAFYCPDCSAPNWRLQQLSGQ